MIVLDTVYLEILDKENITNITPSILSEWNCYIFQDHYNDNKQKNDPTFVIPGKNILFELQLQTKTKTPTASPSLLESDLDFINKYWSNISYKIINTSISTVNNTIFFKLELECLMNWSHINCTEKKPITVSKILIKGGFISLGNIPSSILVSTLKNFMNGLFLSQLEFKYPLCFNKIVRKHYALHSIYYKYNQLYKINFRNVVDILVKDPRNTTIYKMIMYPYKKPYSLPFPTTKSDSSLILD
ncbi:uncharacterized protein SCDLUD_001451 [Saccharomycodes ludwigii]|uniref:uncharacterized protein n=1 Tax=Saccharomycodes ludwigii TaxID=36035 RepID=UPI001E895584|nr:hypothetical protein SCDLUD_001451 [Saccharomycodes ludwigii]KAH3901680.1 hypothetical protein SCDLUD_001451 [Saccharomycodes ludwigii]